MRLLVQRDLFDTKSPEESLALLDLITLVARSPQHRVLLTDPSYVPGSNNGAIDVWLASRGQNEVEALRIQLSNGLMYSAAQPVGGGASDVVTPRRWHLALPSHRPSAETLPDRFYYRTIAVRTCPGLYDGSALL